ncbi:signal peptidase I [Amnibacterium flavum]|uniref:signal peptidase I n=1 Tax=Amnibacterium flavum TaxID=2173173 RepID=UPI0014029957|nr:signal peptidase I [Amnibacterium flavum]
MRVLNLLRWVLLSVLIAVLALPAIIVTASNLTVVEVDGLSMAPTYGIGDVVTIRPPQSGDFVAGTVVTVKDGDSERYTHRIVSVEDDGRLILRGDANDFNDTDPVDPGKVVGVVAHHFTGIWATLIMQLQSWPLRLCVLAMILGLIFIPMAGQAPAPSSRRAEEEMPERPRRERPAKAAKVDAPVASEKHEGSHQETLDLVDSMRSAVARVLLASDRRLSGTYSVTTKPGRGDFPEVRVVIDIVEKPAPDRAEQSPSPAIAAPAQPLSRRAAREATESRRVSPARPAKVAATDSEEMSERRRAHRAQSQRGRRRAQRGRRG